MNLPRRLLMSLRTLMEGRRVPDEDVRLQVVNVTRNTQLASNIEVAGGGAKRAKGLLGRKGLASGEGMWIIPCESVHTIGMQFPIDLVYLDRQHRVKKVRSNVPPWRLSACLSAHSVIELAMGVVLTTQTVRGDLLEFSPTSHPPLI
jgi:hypothetical protein